MKSGTSLQKSIDRHDLTVFHVKAYEDSLVAERIPITLPDVLDASDLRSRFLEKRVSHP
jgi:hypothetical protein